MNPASMILREKLRIWSLFAFIVTFILLLSTSNRCESQEYNIYLRNGSTLKNYSLYKSKDDPNVIIARRGSERIVINKTDIADYEKIQDYAAQQTPQQTQESGQSHEATNNSSVVAQQPSQQEQVDPRCAEMLGEMEKLNSDTANGSIGELVTIKAKMSGLRDEYEMRCMSPEQAQARQQKRSVDRIGRKLDQIQQKQREIQDTQRGIGY